MSHSFELQDAIVNLLKADAEIVAIVGQRVYGHVPDGAAFPYIEIGDFDESDNSTKSSDGVSIDGVIECWDRSAGRKTIKTINARIRELLNFNDIALPSYPSAWVRVDGSRAIREPDESSYHGIVRLTALVE